MGVLVPVHPRVSIKNSFVSILTSRGKDIKRTNFLIDTLGCTGTRTPIGHPYNRSCAIWPQKQPLSIPRVSLVEPTLSWMGAESNGELKEAVFEAEWHEFFNRQPWVHRHQNTYWASLQQVMCHSASKTVSFNSPCQSC